MKKLIIFLMMLSLFFMTSCDAFRKLAGRPTSKELNEMKAELIQEKEAQKAAMLDSIKRVEQAYKDSLALQDSLKQNAGTILNSSAMGGLYTTKLDYKYYVVIGAFKQRAYAERLLEKVNENNIAATLISFRNGFNAIGLWPTNDLNKALAALRRTKGEKYCPEDAWILVNE